MGGQLSRNGRKLGRAFLGSRSTRRYLWARWAISRTNALAERRRLYRRTNVEWDMPGHARLVYSDILGPGPGEVLVRTIASAVSPGTERAGFRSETKTAKFPALPGYSLSGEVVALGRGVRGIDQGDLVATQGPHASLVARPHDLAFRLGPNTNPIEAALLYPGMIALHAIWQGDLRPGERIAIFGRGMIGQLTVLLARVLGGIQITSVARTSRRLNDALVSAADQIVSTGEEDRPDSGAFDLVIEASGEPTAITEAVRAVRPGGRLVLVGSPRRPVLFDFGYAAEHRVGVMGAHISTLSRSSRSDGRDYASAAGFFLRWLDEGRMDVGPLIGEEIDPWEAGLFYRKLSKQGLTSASAVLRWDRLSETDRGGPTGLLARPVDDLPRGMKFLRLPIEGRV